MPPNELVVIHPLSFRTSPLVDAIFVGSNKFFTAYLAFFCFGLHILTKLGDPHLHFLSLFILFSLLELRREYRNYEKEQEKKALTEQNT